MNKKAKLSLMALPIVLIVIVVAIFIFDYWIYIYSIYYKLDKLILYFDSLPKEKNFYTRIYITISEESQLEKISFKVDSKIIPIVPLTHDHMKKLAEDLEFELLNDSKNDNIAAFTMKGYDIASFATPLVINWQNDQKIIITLGVNSNGVISKDNPQRKYIDRIPILIIDEREIKLPMTKKEIIKLFGTNYTEDKTKLFP